MLVFPCDGTFEEARQAVERWLRDGNPTIEAVRLAYPRESHSWRKEASLVIEQIGLLRGEVVSLSQQVLVASPIHSPGLAQETAIRSTVVSAARERLVPILCGPALCDADFAALRAWVDWKQAQGQGLSDDPPIRDRRCRVVLSSWQDAPLMIDGYSPPQSNLPLDVLSRIGYRLEWWHNERPHREDGPAVIYASGGTEWRINGNLHREDGPAVETANGERLWWVGGVLHREDGPAVVCPDGRQEWWIRGIKVDGLTALCRSTKAE